MATLTGGRTARSALSACDTPRKAAVFPPHAADAAWRSVMPSLAGTPHVRVSRDGGRTYPARHVRRFPAEPPDQPCTVPVYDPGSATGRMLALDLDPGRACDLADSSADVERQAAELGQLLERFGGRVLADVSPSGGRHVYVLFAAALPWRELRDVARALALRYPAIDTAPMSSLGGQISPPGARHKSGGWRVLTMPAEDARAAVERPNGPELWAGLLAELAAELQAVEQPSGEVGAPGLLPTSELDDTGVPWVPRIGGRAPLGAELEHVARTGRWDRSRYAGRSEARMAIVGAAAARGWRLAEVRAAIACGAWKGLAGLCERRSEPGRMERLLPAEWRKCTGRISREENLRGWHTSDGHTRPPADESSLAAEYGLSASG